MPKCQCCAMARNVKPEHYQDQVRACREAMSPRVPKWLRPPRSTKAGLTYQLRRLPHTTMPWRDRK